MNPTATIVVAFAAAAVAWFLGGRNKSGADTTETITKAAGSLVEQLRQELQRLTLEVESLRRENAALKVETAELRHVIESLRVAIRNDVEDDGR